MDRIPDVDWADKVNNNRCVCSCYNSLGSVSSPQHAASKKKWRPHKTWPDDKYSRPWSLAVKQQCDLFTIPMLVGDHGCMHPLYTIGFQISGFSMHVCMMECVCNHNAGGKNHSMFMWIIATCLHSAYVLMHMCMYMCMHAWLWWFAVAVTGCPYLP